MMTVRNGLWSSKTTGMNYWVIGMISEPADSIPLVEYQDENGNKYTINVNNFLKYFVKVDLTSE